MSPPFWAKKTILLSVAAAFRPMRGVSNYITWVRVSRHVIIVERNDSFGGRSLHRAGDWTQPRRDNSISGAICKTILEGGICGISQVLIKI